MNIDEFEEFLRKENISFVPRNGYILLFNSVRNFGMASETEDGLILKSNELFYIPPYVEKLNRTTLMCYLRGSIDVKIYLIHGVKDE